MHRLRTALVVTFCLAAVAGGRAQSADPGDAWARLAKVPSGTGLLVTMQDGRRLRGALQRVLPAALVLSARAGAAAEQIARDEIQEVRRASTSRRWWGTAIGAGAGVLAGLVGALNIALRECGGDCTDEKLLVGAVGIGVPIGGTVAGYQLGKRAEVLYRARAGSAAVPALPVAPRPAVPAGVRDGRGLTMLAAAGGQWSGERVRFVRARVPHDEEPLRQASTSGSSVEAARPQSSTVRVSLRRLTRTPLLHFEVEHDDAVVRPVAARDGHRVGVCPGSGPLALDDAISCLEYRFGAPGARPPQRR